MSEWKPISSAPKDGTVILAYFPEDMGVLRVRMNYRQWELFPDGGTEFAYEIEGHPTHWMPLPKLPVINNPTA